MDWVAAIIGIIGCIVLGLNKSYSKYGWLCYATASGINAYLGIKASIAGLSFGAICYMILEIKGYITAHRSQK